MSDEYLAELRLETVKRVDYGDTEVLAHFKSGVITPDDIEQLDCSYPPAFMFGICNKYFGDSVLLRATVRIERSKFDDVLPLYIAYLFGDDLDCSRKVLNSVARMKKLRFYGKEPFVYDQIDVLNSDIVFEFSGFARTQIAKNAF